MKTNKRTINDIYMSYLVVKLRESLQGHAALDGFPDEILRGFLGEEAILDFISKHVVQRSQAYVVTAHYFDLYINGDSIMKAVPDIWQGISYAAIGEAIKSRIGKNVDPDDEKQVEQYNKKADDLKNHIVKKIAIAVNRAIGHLRAAPQINVRATYLYDDAFFTLDDTVGTFHLPLRRHNPADFYHEDNERLLKQYVEHAPMILEELEWNLAVYFGKKRQDTMLYKVAPSNFGKNYVFEALGEIGYAHQSSMETIINSASNRNVGESALDFVKTILVYYDETSYFTKEQKLVFDKLRITEKHKPTVTVDLGPKNFLSADLGQFLNQELISEELRNRIQVLDYRKTSTSWWEFLERTGYEGEGYDRAIQHHFIKRLEHWIELARTDHDEMLRQAEEICDDFASKYSLKHMSKSAQQHVDVYGEMFLEHVEQHEHIQIDGKPLLETNYGGHFDFLLGTNAKGLIRLWNDWLEERKAIGDS